MNNINNYIQEKLKIGSTSKINQNFTDKELHDDYEEVSGAYTKVEKQKYALKYNITTNKIRDIQIEILNRLRDNRQNKKEFTEDDFRDFCRYDIPEKYEKYIEYLDKEPREFVEFLLKHYEEIIKKKSIKIYAPRSIAEKSIVKYYTKLKKYMGIS